MRRKVISILSSSFLLLMLIISTTSIQSFAQNSGDKIAGTWQGALKVSGGLELRLVFHISQKEDGGYNATLDSPDQGAKGIPTGGVTLKEKHLKIDIPAVAGFYEGDFDEEWQSIEGTWNQGGAALPLTVKRVDKVEELKRPQVPQKPYPYNEENVTWENKEAGLTLAGTLTFPKAGGPFPAAILVSGSGPQDRDESLLGHKPFLVLADHLTRNGIAVLRYDDRGVGKSTGNFASATTEDFARDALAGIGFLKTRKEIDAKKIGLIGHSEGGLIAPMAATQSKSIAYIVMLAGPGLNGAEILYLQSALIAKANGISDELIALGRTNSEKIYAIVTTEKSDSVAAQKIRELQKESWAGYSDEIKAEMEKFGDPEKLLEATIKQLLTPWFRFFLAYEPRSALEKVTCPVLAINGEKDLQVPPKENLSAIEDALKKAGNKMVVTKELPGLNHLFQTSETGAPSEYGKIEETFSPTALQMISDWIRESVER